MEVTIIVCTFRRPQIVETLASLLKQDLPNGTALRFLVVDNDATPSAEAMVRRFFAANPGAPYEYVHAPKQNIALARNTGLERCSTRWAIMIDDDEMAEPTCVARLLASAAPDARVVFGRTKAIYPDAAPAWQKAADLHSNTIHLPPGQIDRGYTSIVLLDVAWIKAEGLTFDLSLGKVGGEDVLFFHEVYRAGGLLQYEPEAVVFEPVEPKRLTTGWYWKRRYRSGQVKALLKRRFASVPARLAFCGRCVAVVGLSAVVGGLTAPIRRSTSAKWTGRAVENLGALAYMAGAPLHQEYA